MDWDPDIELDPDINGYGDTEPDLDLEFELGTWNPGSPGPGTWAAHPFQGLSTWGDHGACGERRHLNRSQEASWGILPLEDQVRLQGEPKEVGEHIHLEWSPVWPEGGQRQPLENPWMTPRDLPLNQEGNSAGVLWHGQSRGLGGVQPHCQEWCPEGDRWNLQTVRFRGSSNEDRRLRGLVSHAGHKDHREYRSKENPCDPCPTAGPIARADKQRVSVSVPSTRETLTGPLEASVGGVTPADQVKGSRKGSPGVG